MTKAAHAAVVIHQPSPCQRICGERHGYIAVRSGCRNARNDALAPCRPGTATRSRSSTGRAVRGQLHAFLQWLPLTLASFVCPHASERAKRRSIVLSRQKQQHRLRQRVVRLPRRTMLAVATLLRCVLQLRQLRITPLFCLC